MSGERKERIKIEVVHAVRDGQVLVGLEVEDGTTAGQAIERSGILQRVAGIELVRGRVGVFGKVVSLDYPLRNGDRVEIYRPLLADPKRLRRESAARPKTGPRC